MPKQTGSKSYTDIELCLIFKEIIYLLPYKKSEWENIYEPCKRAVEMYNKTHKDQLIIRKAKAIARKFEDMTYSSKKIASDVAGKESNNNTYTQLCHIATQIKALCKINYLFKEGQKNYNLNKIVIKRRRRILQSINSIERNYYDKKYNEDIENISNLSDDTKSPSLHLSVSNLSSPVGDLKDKNGNAEIKKDIHNANGNSDGQNDALQKMEDIKYIKSVMKDIKENICEINDNDDYDKIVEQSLTTMKTISKILNDAIIFCDTIANRSKKFENIIEDDFSDDVSVFSDNEDTYNNSQISIDKNLNDALRIINEDEKSTETIYANEFINNIENNFSLSNINANASKNKKRKFIKDANDKVGDNSNSKKIGVNNNQSTIDQKMIKINNNVNSNNSINNFNNNNIINNINATATTSANNNNINTFNNINTINSINNANQSVNINSNANNINNNNNNTINFNYNNFDSRNNNNSALLYDQKSANLKGNPNDLMNSNKNVIYSNNPNLNNNPNQNPNNNLNNNPNSNPNNNLNNNPGNNLGYNIQNNDYYYNNGNGNPNGYSNNMNNNLNNNGVHNLNYYNQNYINNFNNNNNNGNNPNMNINPNDNTNSNAGNPAGSHPLPLTPHNNNNYNNGFNYGIIYNNKNNPNNQSNTGYLQNNNIIYNNMNSYNATTANNDGNNNYVNTELRNSYYNN